jgi:hypothetical protein
MQAGTIAVIVAYLVGTTCRRMKRQRRLQVAALPSAPHHFKGLPTADQWHES